MSAVIRRGLLDRRRALVAWAASVGLTGAFFMLVWPSIDDSIGQALDSYPASVKEAFGITTLDSAEQYLSAELFSLILPFALAIFALRAVAAAIAGAQERGHLDVLLSAPISRRQLVVATFAAIAVEVAAILVAAWSPAPTSTPAWRPPATPTSGRSRSSAPASRCSSPASPSTLGRSPASRQA
jgi:ABC-2 type transport system permease protein